jgi:hypothetical protein
MIRARTDKSSEGMQRKHSLQVRFSSEIVPADFEKA